MKVKIKISYEWEEDLTECWDECKAHGMSLEEFKADQINFSHALETLDCAADNHILYKYQRDLQTQWTE